LRADTRYAPQDCRCYGEEDSWIDVRHWVSLFSGAESASSSYGLGTLVLIR
jgi:hypothetical protein